MKKSFLKYFAIIITLFLLPIIFLSTIGLETNIFNEQIKNIVKKNNTNLNLDLKKVKLKLDPIELQFNAKTVGAKI